MNLISAVMVPLIMLGGIFFLISSMFGGGPRFGREEASQLVVSWL